MVFLCSSDLVFAQKNKEDFENTQVRLNLSPALEFEMDPKTEISFKFITSDDIENGVIKNQFARFRIKATRPWTLSVKSLTPYFSGSGTYASQDMPPSVLEIKKTTSGEYIPLAYSDVRLFTGNRGGNFTPGNDFKADIKFTPGFNYNEGYYFITLVYTLTAL
ncbi:hypothetical protein [Daejeonella sp.]|uniref:hypothetical protein n=1 Tax=Daejeonella sp. TaxID=2805397 RepID=UPI003982E1A5